MRLMKHLLTVGLVACFATVLALGCAKSSHKTVRTYEYNDEPPQKRSESDELDSEYKMQSEGEMKGVD